MLRKGKSEEKNYCRLLLRCALLPPGIPANGHLTLHSTPPRLLSVLLLFVDLLDILDDLKHERASDAWNLSLGGLECRLESL